MARYRGTAVASLALLGAMLAAVGCGLGAGAGVGEVSLRVTRDFGAAPVAPPSREWASESDTAMRVLERNADIDTSYGGRYVRSIDNIAEATRAGRRYDWFFFVNGVEASVGAADFPLRGGEAVWWDYRDWTSALYVPAVVGSWPEPFRDGYEGKRHPVVVECLGGGTACGTVRQRLADAGVKVAAGAPKDAIRVLVGPWARLRSDPAAAQLERGPGTSGVYADFRPTRGFGAPFAPPGNERRTGSYELLGLDAEAKPAHRFGPGAGLVAATRRYEAPPVWLVTGATDRGVRAAAGLLDAADLRDRYAAATEAGRETSLPVAGSAPRQAGGEAG